MPARTLQAHTALIEQLSSRTAMRMRSRGATEDLIATLRGFKRQALHAETLEFAHPVTGEPVRCTAPVPDDLVQLVRALRDDTVAAAEKER